MVHTTDASHSIPVAPVPAPDGLPAAAWITRLAQPLAATAAGDLSGLLCAVKDNIDVAGLATTAACPAFARMATEDAAVVRRLRAAGALIAGKTNLDQFACGLSGTRSPWGAVPNSFAAQLVCGGSSSGSAFAVASGAVDFALGTDTAGSGRVPAGLNNIVGLKPSRGLISAAGVLPAAQSVDCVSILTRSVALAVRVLRAAMAPDPADPYSRELALAPAHWPQRFRFGLPSLRAFFGDTQAEQAFDEAIARMQELGGTPVAVDYTPLAQAAELLYGSALLAERYAALRGFFDAHEAQVIEPVRSILARGRGFGAADLVAAQTRLRALGQQAQAMWQRIDVLLLPTAPTHCTIAQMRADPVGRNSRMGVYTNFVNLLDYAALAVPSSLRADGLPFGVTLIAPCGSDFALAALGQRYHHASGLAQGATGLPLPAPEALVQPPPLQAGQTPLQSTQTALAPAAPGAAGGPGSARIAVVGAHLSGQPLNAQLTGCGARLVASTRSADCYRLYALPASSPPKPGLLRVAPGQGGAVELEVWELPLAHYGAFVAQVPPPLAIGTLLLADGSQVQGFLCEPLALAGAQDITGYGGWRAWLRACAAI